MNYGNIKSYDIADGTGVRVSLFVSGCRHHCKGCFNAPTWDFNYGKPFTRETQDKLLELLAPSYIEGFSLLGGEPFEPENQPVLAELLEEIRRTFPDKSIWCYSGYLFDKDMVPGGKIYTPFTDRMLLHRRSGRRRVYSGIEKPLPSVQREQQSANSAFKRW